MSYVKVWHNNKPLVLDVRFYYDGVWHNEADRPTVLTDEQADAFLMLRAALVDRAAMIDGVGRLYQYQMQEDGGPDGYELQLWTTHEDIPSAW